jgi:hypothetical protein
MDPLIERSNQLNTRLLQIMLGQNNTMLKIPFAQVISHASLHSISMKLVTEVQDVIKNARAEYMTKRWSAKTFETLLDEVERNIA